MPVFVIIPQPTNPNTAQLAGAIHAAFPGDEHFDLEGQRGWFVFAKGTAQELSGQLGVTSGLNGAAVIVEVASYFGRATPDTWAWIKKKMEAPPGA
jgi:hypothetical protein